LRRAIVVLFGAHAVWSVLPSVYGVLKKHETLLSAAFGGQKVLKAPADIEFFYSRSLTQS
jgi:hypothetical protein